MRRALAVVVALGLVGGAYVVRTRVIEAPAAGAGGDGAPAVATLRVVCDPLVAAVCDDLDGLAVTVEDPAATAERLVAAAAPDIDVWVTAAFWPVIVDELRRGGARDVLFAELPEPLARSPLVLAVREGTGGLDGCADWTCLANALQSPEPPRLVLGNPARSSDGLAVLGQAASGLFGSTDFGLQQFGGTFATWLRGLQAGQTAERPLERALQLGFAGIDGVATTEAEAQTTLARSTRIPVEVAYPDPLATVDLVVAPLRGVDAAALTGLGAALADAGWRTGGGDPPLPADDGLPDPGVLEALRQEWQR